MKKALFTLFILLVAAVFIAGCTPPDPGGEKEKTDDTWTVNEQADDNEMYKTLVKGVLGSLKDISDEKVNTTNPIFSIDSKMKLEFNDHLLWFIFKLNYKLDDDTVLKFSAEIRNEDESEIIIGAYFMNNFLYLKLMDGEAGKMKFPIKNQVVGDLFPIQSKDVDIADLAIMLSAVIEIDGDITCKSRMFGTIPEYQYICSIDLPTTLQNIVNSLDLEQLEGVDTETLSVIIQRVLGVSLEQIQNGQLPESSVDIDFATSGDKLSNFLLNLKVEQPIESPNTLFGGGDIDLSIDLDKLVIDKKYTTIEFFNTKIEVGENLVNEYTTYPNYLDQTFGVRLNLTEKGATAEEDRDYTLNAELKLDLEEINSNELLFEVLDDTQTAVTGLYFLDGILYLYTTKEDGYQKRVELELDIIALYEDIADGVEIEDSQPDEKKAALEYVAFIIGALRLGNDDLSFAINNDFYEVLFPGFEDIISYGDALLPEEIDLAALLLDAFGLDVVEYLMGNSYVFTIDLSDDAESFIYVVDGDIAFPEDMVEPV